MERVRVNAKYVYQPVLFDTFLSQPFGVADGILHTGDTVRVVNKYGCPKANTMGMCYIETLAGQFAGMVCVGSLDRA